MRISDWSSDVCSSDLPKLAVGEAFMDGRLVLERGSIYDFLETVVRNLGPQGELPFQAAQRVWEKLMRWWHQFNPEAAARSEEHTSELQSLMRISYAVFCLKKKKTTLTRHNNKT